jgi:hypothetical protein
MLYVVELNFKGEGDAERFMPFYAEHMRDLRTTPGLTTAQRFDSVFPTASRFMQVYTIDNVDVMQSKAYKSVGGPGNPVVDDHAKSLRDWHRNVFEGMRPAPNVPGDKFLLVVDERVNAGAMNGFACTWTKSIALDRHVAERAFAIIDDPARVERLISPMVRVFRPITPQF